MRQLLKKQRIWALEPGMRQKLVPFVGNDINDMISSIQVGAKVGVMFFVDANYRGKGNTTIQSINSLPPEYNDAISSLIIFPREWLTPLGVSLAGPSVGATPLEASSRHPRRCRTQQPLTPMSATT